MGLYASLPKGLSGTFQISFEAVTYDGVHVAITTNGAAAKTERVYDLGNSMLSRVDHDVEFAIRNECIRCMDDQLHRWKRSQGFVDELG